MPRKNTGQPNGRKVFKPTDDERKTVSLMASVGIPHAGIALCIREEGIAQKTLIKHFSQELKTAAIQANTKIGGTIYQSAISGNMSAAIWWSRARMGWSEKKEVDVNVNSGVLVSPANMTPEEWINKQKNASIYKAGNDKG